MIEIQFSGYQMTAHGHAGFADYGEDIICAGMSTVFVTTAEMMLRMQTDGLLNEEPVVRLNSGDVLLKMEPVSFGEEKAEWLWEFLKAGCRLMAESYPQYVVITEAKANE